MQERFKIAFDPVAADRLTIAGTAAFGAQIIWMLGMASLRPAGRQGRGAIGAADIAAQREVLIYVLMPWRIDTAVEALLNALIGLETDEAFMLCGTQRHAPARKLDIPRIDRLIEQEAHALMTNDPRGVFRKQGIVLQKSHHIRLRLEAAQGIAFKGLLHDGSGGFGTDQHFAASANQLVGVSHGSLKHPVAVHDTGHHPVFRLLGVLLALML